MPFSLIPQYVYASYKDITPKQLKEWGITLLLSDLDFTLATKKTCRPDAALCAWIADLKENHIVFMIISNNRSEERVREFCENLDISYQGHARKPSTKGLRRAMNHIGADASHTAMMGDKILTDVLGANRAGVLSLMVEPVGGAVTLWQKILHALQQPFKNISIRRQAKKKH